MKKTLEQTKDDLARLITVAKRKGKRELKALDKKKVKGA